MEANSAGFERTEPVESTSRRRLLLRFKIFKKTGFEICFCDFNSELALAQPFYNQLSFPLDM